MATLATEKLHASHSVPFTTSNDKVIGSTSPQVYVTEAGETLAITPEQVVKLSPPTTTPLLIASAELQREWKRVSTSHVNQVTTLWLDVNAHNAKVEVGVGPNKKTIIYERVRYAKLSPCGYWILLYRVGERSIRIANIPLGVVANTQVRIIKATDFVSFLYTDKTHKIDGVTLGVISSKGKYVEYMAKVQNNNVILSHAKSKERSWALKQLDFEEILKMETGIETHLVTQQTVEYGSDIYVMTAARENCSIAHIFKVSYFGMLVTYLTPTHHHHDITTAILPLTDDLIALRHGLTQWSIYNITQTTTNDGETEHTQDSLTRTGITSTQVPFIDSAKRLVTFQEQDRINVWDIV